MFTVTVSKRRALLLKHLVNDNVKFNFLSVYSTWYGSCHERLIGTIKNCMYKVIGRNRLTYFEMLNTLSNIKNSINSRPLTYSSNSDFLESITPNCFLKLYANPSLFISGYDDNIHDPEIDTETLSRTLNIQEEMFEKFRKLWHTEYLLSLREHSRKLYQKDFENKIRVDDVVLVRLPNNHFGYWDGCSN